MAQDFEKLNIQWFPGHMTKAQRMIEEHMKQVDAVCEILDARIPMASRNPDIDRLAGDKPRIVVLNRTDLADPKATARWRTAFQRQGMTVLETDSVPAAQKKCGYPPKSPYYVLKKLLERMRGTLGEWAA